MRLTSEDNAWQLPIVILLALLLKASLNPDIISEGQLNQVWSQASFEIMGLLETSLEVTVMSR